MSISADQKKALDDEAVRNFQEYLRIPSVHPDINYGELFRKVFLISIDITRLAENSKSIDYFSCENSPFTCAYLGYLYGCFGCGILSKFAGVINTYRSWDLYEIPFFNLNYMKYVNN